ncbi:MAG: type II toxin-antitoxin system RelE/ParE family toxin [Flexilinea sp.]|nr:type II toxin-antitoxin system RelE/ParE family toxin [Flexilinea sp.]
MVRIFVYTSSFRKTWEAMGLSDNELPILENALLKNPKLGNVIEGTGGARKIRIQLNSGRGKSGGGRVIYIDFVEKERIYFLLAYPKNKQANLTNEQKKMIRNIISEIKRE